MSNKLETDLERRPVRTEIDTMFDSIAGNYDFLNRVLSMRQDIRWRKILIKELPKKNALKHMDLATGTGDLAFQINKTLPNSKIEALDFSKGMLEVAAKKQKASKLQAVENIHFDFADAMHLEKYYDQFDSMSISFGIRNVLDLNHVLKEIKAILKPSGKALILEFGQAEGTLFAPLYKVYNKYFLAKVGKLLSKNKTAYQYLDESIQAFPSGVDFLERMQEAGFKNCQQQKIMFGCVRLYTGYKEEN